MASIVSDISQWPGIVKDYLPVSVRNLFDGSSRRELLKRLDATILVFDNSILSLATGQRASLPMGWDATSLAVACRGLLEPNGGESTVVLLLPPAEFAATSVAMPGLNREALTAALRFQTDALLPGYGKKLTLAVNPSDSESAHADIALWIPESRLETLFTAFSEQQLFLAAVAPRNLVLADTSGNLDLVETDLTTATHIKLTSGVLTRWQHIERSDLEQDIFLKQWQLACGQAETDQRLETGSESYESLYRRSNGTLSSAREYCFFPPGALHAKRKVEKGKQVLRIATVLAGIGIVCALPFLLQSLEMSRLKANLVSQQALSSSARADRNVVQEFENQWGLISNFPDQDVVDTMYTLQNVLSPEQLTSLEVTEGVISIEGESTEPQAILQRLEQHPMFTEVAFSNATNNSRYYIDLRLSTVNFEGYLVRYFPDQGRR